MAYRDLSAFFDGGEKRSFVIDSEGEDAVFVWGAERAAVDCGIGCGGSWYECKSVERREHAKFELNSIGGRGNVWFPMRFRPDGELDREGL